MVTPADVTCLAAHLGAPVALAEFAARCADGYASRLAVSMVDGVPRRTAFDADAWLFARRPRPDLDRRFSVRGQLGVVELHFARDGARVREAMLAGDLIAAAATVAAIEDRLRGCALERVDEVVRDVLVVPEGFLLGLGSPADVAATLARGVAT